MPVRLHAVAKGCSGPPPSDAHSLQAPTRKKDANNMKGDSSGSKPHENGFFTSAALQSTIGPRCSAGLNDVARQAQRQSQGATVSKEGQKRHRV